VRHAARQEDTVLLRRSALAVMLAAPAAVQAQPARAIRIIVPFPPGGSNDVIARPLAERMQARLGNRW
jgi:tripartite-type tricarboxylate transporter receptor subunit TctC